MLAPGLSWASQATGGDITGLTISPQTITSNTTDGRTLTFNIGIKIYPVEFRTKCGGNTETLWWYIWEDRTLNDDQVGTGSETIPRGENATITRTITVRKTVDVYSSARERFFYATLNCQGFTSTFTQITRSANVKVAQAVSTAAKTWACVAADGKYACSPSNKQDLSDVPNNACQGKPAVQVGSNLCGYPASPEGHTGTGRTENFDFQIDNPLGGGANTVFDFIGVIMTWITNLAIPIAVILILWAGLLMLTAGVKPDNWKKGKDILKYTVIGLAIILVGKGFITLVIDVLKLGGSPTEQTQGTGGETGPGTSQGICVNNTCSNGAGPCRVNADCSGGLSTIGESCLNDRTCMTGLKCKDRICQRPNGNSEGEYCLSGRNCASGFSCDRNNPTPINDKLLGICAKSNTMNLAIGYYCEKDENCQTGLKCNTICQRRGGNELSEACYKSPPSGQSNCKSSACSVLGDNLIGVCVENPTR